MYPSDEQPVVSWGFLICFVLCLPLGMLLWGSVLYSLGALLSAAFGPW